MSDGTDGKNASTTTTRLPDIRAEVREDGTGEISIDGVVERVRMANLAEAGAAITTRHRGAGGVRRAAGARAGARPRRGLVAA